MKILFLSHQSDFIYGGEVVTLAFIRGLRDRGVEAELALPKGPFFSKARAEGIVVHEISSVEFRRKWRLLPRLLAAQAKVRRQLRAILAEGNFTHLHATSLKSMVYARAMRGKVPLIWHHHNILPDTVSNHLWCRWLGKSASRIVVPSLATLAGLRGVPSERIRVVYNGFDPAQWSSRKPRGEGKEFCVAVIGELSERKGQDRILRLLRDWSARDRSFSLRTIFVGEAHSDPGFGTKLKEAFRGFPVEFFGRREDIPKILQEVDLLIVPSRNDPFPTVIIEAALSGVPVLGSRVGGIPEMVKEGTTGFLFENDEEIFPLVERVFDKEIWLDLSKGSRAFAEEKFSLARSCEILEVIYKEVALEA